MIWFTLICGLSLWVVGAVLTVAGVDLGGAVIASIGGFLILISAWELFFGDDGFWP